MAETLPIFLSCGDLIADRRYHYARDFEARGDLAAAADLLAQAVERAPQFASAWFALGDLQERRGDPAAAGAAFAQALASDPADRHGAGLRLARLGAATGPDAMSPAYVRTLFDQYAPTFDTALRQRLGYRGPELLRAALIEVASLRGRRFHFRRFLDLGCGTGLMAEALGGICEQAVGVDLSPAMITQAERKRLYAQLAVADMLAFLREQAGARGDDAADLIVAADAFVYMADLTALCAAAARALAADGLFAFTVETHAGEDVRLGEKLRYAHGEAHVRHAILQAGLDLLRLAAVSTRTEAGLPVPGLLVIAAIHNSLAAPLLDGSGARPDARQ